MNHACLAAVRRWSLRCMARLQVCYHTHFSGVLAYSNLPTETPATPWVNHTIVHKTDNSGKNYCCADAYDPQDTLPVSSQSTDCNCNHWS